MYILSKHRKKACHFLAHFWVVMSGHVYQWRYSAVNGQVQRLVRAHTLAHTSRVRCPCPAIPSICPAKMEGQYACEQYVRHDQRLRLLFIVRLPEVA